MFYPNKEHSKHAHWKLALPMLLGFFVFVFLSLTPDAQAKRPFGKLYGNLQPEKFPKLLTHIKRI